MNLNSERIEMCNVSQVLTDTGYKEESVDLYTGYTPQTGDTSGAELLQSFKHAMAAKEGAGLASMVTPSSHINWGELVTAARSMADSVHYKRVKNRVFTFSWHDAFQLAREELQPMVVPKDNHSADFAELRYAIISLLESVKENSLPQLFTEEEFDAMETASAVELYELMTRLEYTFDFRLALRVLTLSQVEKPTLYVLMMQKWLIQRQVVTVYKKVFGKPIDEAELSGMPIEELETFSRRLNAMARGENQVIMA